MLKLHLVNFQNLEKLIHSELNIPTRVMFGNIAPLEDEFLTQVLLKFSRLCRAELLILVIFDFWEDFQNKSFALIVNKSTLILTNLGDDHSTVSVIISASKGR